MKSLLALARLTTLLAPIGILLFWGGRYLYACFEFLTNPGMPLELRYRAKGKEAVNFTANRYVVDLRDWTLKVLAPRAANDRGDVLFYADTIEAVGLQSLIGDSRRATVIVRNAFATVVRKPDGRLDTFDYIPETEGPSGDFPFAVDVSKAKLKFVESTGDRRYVQNAVLSGLRIEGVGDRWIASGSASLLNVGDVSISVQNQPNSGVWLRGNSDRLEVSELFRVFRQTKEGKRAPSLRNIDSDSLVVNGPFELFLPTEKEAKIFARVTAVSEGFRYGNEFRASRARFEGAASATGIQGTLTADAPGLDAKYSGLATWQDQLRFDGRLVASASSIAALPKSLRLQLPSQVSVRGPIDFDGRMAFAEDAGLALNGIANAESVAAFYERIESPQAIVDYGASGLRLTAQRGFWRGSKFDGSLAYSPKSRALTGVVRAERIDIGGLGRRLDIETLTGSGDVDVLIGGTVEEPVAHIRASTDHQLGWTKGMTPQLGRARVAATLTDGQLRIEQAFIVTPAGSVSATGRYDLTSKALALDAVGSGIDLSELNPELAGIGRFKGSVSGPLDKLRYQGTAELFGLKVQDQIVPVVSGVIQGDTKSLTATRLQAVKGTGKARGSVNLRFRDMALNGEFVAEGVQLSDFMGDDYLASIDLDQARLGGTFAKPTFDAKGRATDIVIFGSRIEGASAVVTYRGDVLKVDEFVATDADGKVSGYLEYWPAKKSGEATFDIEKVAIQKFLAPEVAATFAAEVSGSGSLTFANGGLKVGSGSGSLANIALNETQLGGGEWKLTSNGSTVAGDVFFGGLGPSVEITVNRYGLEDRGLDASLWVRKLGVHDVHNIIERYLPKWDERVLALLHSANGQIGLSGGIGGTLDSPDVSQGVVTVEELQIGGKTGGTLSTAFSKQGRVWNLSDVDWKGGPIGLKASGEFEEGGILNLMGTIDNADLSYLSLIEPSLASLVGWVDSFFALSGTVDSPLLRATPLSDNSSPWGGIGLLDIKGNLNNPIKFAFADLTASNWNDGQGGIDGLGMVEYQGYSAKLAMSLPFRFPFDLVPQAPVSAQLELNRREIGDIEQLAKQFDTKLSTGTVSGLVNLSGTKENLATVGDIRLEADRLVVANDGQDMRDVRADLQFLRGNVAANLSAKSASGGSITANASSPVPTLDDILRQFRSGRLEELFASPLTGRITSDGFAIQSKIVPNGMVSGVIDSNISIAGTLKNPRAKGEIDVKRGHLKMPDEFNQSVSTDDLKFNPYFDLEIRTGSPARFENSTANIEMIGSGSVNGTLQDMDALALLRLTKGTLRLPTSRINLEPGGTVKPYLSINSGIPQAWLDIEIEGNTRAVGPSKTGRGAQRYEINLDIKGDLLKTGGLNMTATSSPADLSQEEIFALIGRLDLIEGLASGVQSGSPEEDIRNAIYGLTPYYLDPYTSQLATMFGLDYLTPEINTLDGVSILFAKTLGRNLVLSGSRQVTQVNQNYPLKYDLNLAYQWRFGGRNDRRRVNFIVGIDEVRPWRIAVEYTFRF